MSLSDLEFELQPQEADLNEMEQDQTREEARNQRQEERVDFRTTGFAYILGEEGFEPIGPAIRVWTVDVSTIGCMMRCNQEVSAKRIMLKLILPEMDETVIEASIVRNLEERAKLLNGKEKNSYLYGVKFHRRLSVDELGVVLPAAEEPIASTAHVLSATEQDTAPVTRSEEVDAGLDTRVLAVGGLTLTSLALLIMVYLF